MKASMQSLCPVFSTDRMVQEYAELSYLPSYHQWSRFVADDLSLARDLARWKARIFKAWPLARIVQAEAQVSDAVAVGSSVPVMAQVALGEIPPQDVAVEGYFGVLDSKGNIQGGEVVQLDHSEDLGGGIHQFNGQMECRFCGRHGFMLRVMPRHSTLGNIYESGYLIWG
jgi:starch phosphorylase